MGQTLNAILPAVGTKVGLFLPSLSVFACNSLMFLFCQWKKDNSFIDVWWGLSFIVPNAVMIGLQLRNGLTIDARVMLVNLLVSAWGMRLAWHIGRRHKEEDYRYKAMRDRWNKIGTRTYYFYAFMYIFMMQALFGLVVNGAALYITKNSAGTPLKMIDYAGLAVATSGLLIETVADSQLNRHIANPDPKKGKFCQTGLWKYSRHPNYFGEITVWWGVWLMACGVPGGYQTVYAPSFITWLLLRLSGVPLLEKKQRQHPEWAAYAAKTPKFWPWFPKSSATIDKAK
jgi:steroid 5-alpha reductase family enzyme